MIRKWCTIGIILLFVGTCIIPTLAQNGKQTSSKGNWLYVGGSGPGNYTKIQDAIYNASDGDTVFVYHGTYNESVGISKSIFVIGEDKNTTIIDGQFRFIAVVQFVADNIFFSGFSVIHSKFNLNGFGMSVTSHNIVTNNIIADNLGCYGGMLILGDYNQVNNNIVRNNTLDGISIRSSYTTISENDISDNLEGISVFSSTNLIITKNHIHNNSEIGIYVRAWDKNEFSYNIIEDNGAAAFSFEQYASNNVIFGNIIKNNGDGLVIINVQYLSISNNSFYGDGIRFKGNAINFWASHDITNNYINGKPIYYYKFEKDKVVPVNPEDAGQVILAGCTSCLIENVTISNVHFGIQLGYSSDNKIRRNHICNNNIGMYLFNSEKNVIETNIIANNSDTGISLEYSNMNIIETNIIANNSDTGVTFGKCTTNVITKNDFSNNNYALWLYLSTENSIEKNNFINTIQKPIYFRVGPWPSTKNFFKNNYYSSHLSWIPYIIHGELQTKYTYYVSPGVYVPITIPWINIDLHPAMIPYDIEGS